MKIGDEAEFELMNFISAIDGFLVPQKNEDKNTRIEYDIACGYNRDPVSSAVEGVVYFEVKNDVMASKTGNIALEYFNSKSMKASGITATKADWWVHKINGELWAIRVKELIDFTKNEKPDKIIIGGGDNNADLMIYKIERFTSVAKQLSTLTEIEDFI